MDPLSNYCKLTLHDTSNYCQFCAILDPRIFKKFRKFSVFISSSKTNTNTSLRRGAIFEHARGSQNSQLEKIISKGEFIFIHLSVNSKYVCICLKPSLNLRPFDILTESYGSCEWSLLVSIHCAHTAPLCDAWISNCLSFEFLDAIAYFKKRMQL